MTKATRHSIYDPKYAGLDTRACRKCGAVYPAHTDFFRSQKQGKYLDRVCRKCVLLRQLVWTHTAPGKLEARRETNKRWRLANLEHYRKLQREYWHKTKARRACLKPYVPRKWELVRDFLAANVWLCGLTHKEIKARLPEALQNVGHSTIYKARNYVLRYKVTAERK